MKKSNGLMDKTIVSLMCKNIEKQCVDINKMVYENSEAAINYIHEQYLKAQKEMKKKSRS